MSKQRHQAIPRTLCIVRNEDKILLMKYSAKKGAMEGFYNLPGGHIESDEGILENAKKEIWEETGLRPETIRLTGVVHIKNFFNKKVMMFVTVSESSVIETTANDEGELLWVKQEGIAGLKVFEDVKIILDRIDKSTEVFTAKSDFDDDGSMKYFEFE